MTMTKTKEYRKQLAETFAHVLEEKGLDWKKGWDGFRSVPMNGQSEHKYKGMNRFYLTMVAMQREYGDPRWYTFHQIQEKGWRLNNAKGQGVKVEYWFPYDREEKKSLSWEEFRRRGAKFNDITDHSRYLLRATYKTVFNASLIDGVPDLPEPERREINPDELIRKVSVNMGVEIVHDGGGQAFYRPSDDTIHLPIPEYFYSEYEYDSTALHELAHATGARHRLNRDLSHGYGSESYAYEELVAEISSCFMSSGLEVEQSAAHIENHKAYVQGWISVIREKPDTLMKAIGQAEKAASYMEYQAGLLSKEDYEKIAASTRTEETVYHLDQEKYLRMQISGNECDYTLYDRRFQEVGSGHLEASDLTLEGAREEILKSQQLSPERIDLIPNEEYESLPGMVDGEPAVTINWTESGWLKPGQTLPFSEANGLFGEIDQRTRETYGQPGRYDKTDYTITYLRQGRIHTYVGRQDFGDLDGTLSEHILKYADQREAAEDFVLYLNLHENIGLIEKRTEEAKKDLLENVVLFDQIVYNNLDYYEAVESYVHQYREELNTSLTPVFPEIPQLKDYLTYEEPDDVMEEEDEIGQETGFQEQREAGKMKKNIFELSPQLRELVLKSGASDGEYCIEHGELPAASLELLKRECREEGILNWVSFDDPRFDVIGNRALAEQFDLSVHHVPIQAQEEKPKEFAVCL